MKKIFKENWFKVGILFCLAVLCVIYYFNAKSNQVSSVSIKKEFSSKNKYYLKFWGNLSKGDISSTECQKAIERYSERYPETVTSFYSYEKKRCFGFREFYNNSDKGNLMAEIVVDVATGAELIYCIDTKTADAHMIECKDSQNKWTWSKENTSLPYPEPYPISNNIWEPLKEASAR